MCPILFGAWGLSVRSHPALIALGALTGVAIVLRLARIQAGIRRRVAIGATVLVALTAVIGARLQFILLSGFNVQPLDILNLWSGGVNAPGGLIGVCFGVALAARLFKFSPARFADAVVPGVAVAIALGRIGCFLNGCCFGKPCPWPWCIRLPSNTLAYLLHVDRGLVTAAYGTSAPLHPLQLYFSACSLGIAALSVLLHSKRRFDGEVALGALVVWSLSSAALELLRESYPGRPYWGVLPKLFWVVTVMGGASLIALALLEANHRRRAKALSAGRDGGDC